MPKMKTKSLAKKRFSKTGTGKIKAAKAFFYMTTTIKTFAQEKLKLCKCLQFIRN